MIESKKIILLFLLITHFSPRSIFDFTFTINKKGIFLAKVKVIFLFKLNSTPNKFQGHPRPETEYCKTFQIYQHNRTPLKAVNPFMSLMPCVFCKKIRIEKVICG